MTDKKELKLYIDNGQVIDWATSKPIAASELHGMSKTFDLRVIGGDGADSQLATGIAIPTYRKSSWDYLNKSVKDFDDTNADIRDILKACELMYRFETVVGTVIDIFADFAITDFEITGVDKKAKALLDSLKLNINQDNFDSKYIMCMPQGLYYMAQEIISEWFIKGNVFPYIQWNKVKVEGLEGNYTIPSNMVLIDPQRVNIGNYKNKIGGRIIRVNEINSQNSAEIIDDGMRSSNNILEYNNILDGAKPMDHRDIYHIKRKSNSYRLWGNPYLSRVMTAVKAKRKLRALEDATIDGMINYLIIFKVGSPDKDSPFHKPQQSRLTAFSNLLKYPQASNMIVWPHDIETIVVGPEGKVLEFKEKYKEVDTDILRGLGAPMILIDGTGSATTSWPAIMAVAERLEKARYAVGSYFERLCRQTLKKNNMLEGNNPKIEWFKSNLRDDKSLKTLVLAFYDRGLLPIETALKESGYNYEDLTEKMKEEDRLNLDDLFKRRDVPFSPVSTSENPKRDGDQGRPTDNTNTTNTEVASRWTESIRDKMFADMAIYLKNACDDIVAKKMTNDAIDLTLYGAFIRMSEISAITTKVHYESMAGQINIGDIFYPMLTGWREKYLEKIKSFMQDELHKHLSRNKTAIKDVYIVDGILLEATKKIKLFTKEMMRNTDLAKELHDANKAGYLGAYIRTPEDTDCESCKTINGNWYQLENIFEMMPLHPHQRFKLDYTKSIPMGNKQDPVQVKVNNKSKVL